MRDFIDKYKKLTNELVYPDDPSDYEDLRDVFLEALKLSIGRQFIYPEPEQDKPLRLSSLGKVSAFELLAKKVGLINQGGSFSVDERLRLIFFIGDLFEPYFEFLLSRMGDYSIEEKQRTVLWNGVEGHTDMIVKSKETHELHLLELKTANDYYFKSVMKRGYPGDERGYLTQLLTYSEATEIPRERCHWVFLNKNTAEIKVLNLSDIPDEVCQERLDRGKRVIDSYDSCNTLDDVYKLSQPIPPSIEINKNKEFQRWENGALKLYCPSSVNHPELCYKGFWEKKWGKERFYVTDYNYPEHLQEHKPNVAEMALWFTQK